MLIRELGGPPFSFTVHGPDEFDAPIALAIPEKVARALFVVAITNFCKAQLQRWSFVDDWRKIEVVRSGVPEEFFKSATPTPDAPELLTIGRLGAQKGHMTLLAAIRRVVDQRIDVRLVVAGDGELRKTLEAEVDRLNLAGVVELIGAVSERQVRDRLASCRVLVMASYAEGLPGVIMEAMAMQRAVVATAVNGIPELVFPGRNGWLAPAGDPRGLSDAIVEALRMPIDQLRTMGRAAQEDARSRHHLDTTIREMCSLFERSVMTVPDETPRDRKSVV
jgi:glycosyltransferase involved in cell wall biosynthesis